MKKTKSITTIPLDQKEEQIYNLHQRPSPLLIPVEACEFLKIKMSKLRSMVFHNELPVIRINRLLRFHQDDLMMYIEKQKS